VSANGAQAARSPLPRPIPAHAVAPQGWRRLNRLQCDRQYLWSWPWPLCEQLVPSLRNKTKHYHGSCQFTPLHQATISSFTNVSLASDDTAQHNTVPSSSRSAQHAIIGRLSMATYGTVDVWLDRVKDIALIIRKYAAETEEKRRLSRSVVDAMLQAGLYSHTAGDFPCHRCRGPGGRPRPGCGWYVGNPQRIQVPAVLRGCAQDHAARVRFSKSLRVSRRTDTGGGVRLGLLCFVSIQFSLCPKAIP
jgi:hypothetical protein